MRTERLVRASIREGRAYLFPQVECSGGLLTYLRKNGFVTHYELPKILVGSLDDLQAVQGCLTAVPDEHVSRWSELEWDGPVYVNTQ